MQKDPTEIDLMTKSEHRVLCALVANVLDKLEWRENGLGLLQAYLAEGDAAETRVHVWHPALRKPGMLDSGNIHDHRFNMVSRVLVGSIYHAWVRPERIAPEDCRPHGDVYNMCDVTNARTAHAQAGKFDSTVETHATPYTIERVRGYIEDGQIYRFPKFEFHESCSDELCITVIEKHAQEAAKARIMWPSNRPLVHAFGGEPTGNAPDVLRRAHAALLARWAELNAK